MSFAAVLSLHCTAALAHSDLSGFALQGQGPVEHDAESAAGRLFPARIVIDPRAVTEIVIKINARLTEPREIFVGRYVRKGEVLAEMESAELETVQQAYIAMVSNLDAVMTFSVTSDAKLMEGKENLLWRGMSEADLRQIEETRAPKKRVAIRAPVSGFLSSINISNNQIVNGGLQVGQTAAAGTTFATIADPRRIMVEAYLPVATAARIRPGEAATVALPGAHGQSVKVDATVIQVFRFASAATQRRAVRLRLEGDPGNGMASNGLMATVSFPGLMGEERHDH